MIALICVTALLFVGIRAAQRDATRMKTFGRMSQLRLALANYQFAHGKVPPREHRNVEGTVVLGWLAAVLPYVEQQEVFKLLNFETRFDSPENKEAVIAGKQFWNWYSDDGYFPCPLSSPESIWDPSTGQARGLLGDYPNAIALVVIPSGVERHALEPFAVTEDQIKEILGRGESVYFIDCDGRSGTVEIEKNSVIFKRAIRS